VWLDEASDSLPTPIPLREGGTVVVPQDHASVDPHRQLKKPQALMKPPVDYAASGLTIEAAMLDLVTRCPDKTARPTHILWNGLSVKTADCLSVPTRGLVKIEILSKDSNVTQGIDLKIEEGALCLKGGEEVLLLRTWADDRYEDIVEYPYHSASGRLWVWNVYKLHLPNGETRDEKWTGNAGFWIETIENYQRIYHCSNGRDGPPNFESLVFRLTVVPLGSHGSV
jgi:hypothetical protein